MPRVSPRTQPAKPPLTRESVLDAGLRVLRERGIERVTMRAVAAELETGAASLYVYVSNRRDLLNQMFDLICGEIELGDPPDSGRWREQVEELMGGVMRLYERYPGSARIPLGNIPRGPNAVRIAERLLSLLLAGGVDERSAAWFLDAVFLFVNATGYEATVYAEEGLDLGDIVDEIRDGFASLDADRFPHFTALASPLTSGSSDERFRFGLRLMLEGLLHAPPPDPAE
jgi:AcrR family transcriptional regulator